MGWIWRVARMGQTRSEYSIFVGKSQGNTLERHRHRLENNHRMDFKEIG